VWIDRNPRQKKLLRFQVGIETMQRFNAPLTTEDRQFARRIWRIMLAAYTSTALALSAGVVARIALKNPTTVNAPIEASAKTGTIGQHSEAPVRLMRAGPRS
jgi:hypothetical protein